MGLIRFLSGSRERRRAREREEARSFRDVMGSPHEGVWRVDPRGTTLEANACMARMLGFDPEELIGRSCFDFVPPEWAERASQAWARVLAGESLRMDFCLRRRDGGEVYVVVANHVERDARGRVTGVLGLFVDVSERRRAEAEAREAASLLEAALESTADGLLIVDRAGRIVRFNERFGRMWRIPQDILASRDDGRAIGFVLSQLKDPGAFEAKIRQLYASPEAESFDTLRFQDGRTFERYSVAQRVRGEVVGRVWSFRDVTDRERAEAERRQAVEREATIAQNLDTALFTFVLGRDRRISRYEYFSLGAQALYGVPAAALGEDPEFWIRRVHPDDLRDVVRPALERVLGLHGTTIEFRYEASRDLWRWHRARFTPRRGPEGTVIVDGLETDVTERVALEEQLRRAQKMEAIGQLAGGVAHDFNNILTAILGYADLLLRQLGTGDPHRHAVEEIRKGGDRAAALTRQLLAFSRRAAAQPRIVDLNAALRDLAPMIARIVGENIALDLELCEVAPSVRVDLAQLEQVIVNLVVNARDAMPGGGAITIATGRAVLPAGATEPGAGTLPPGSYVRLMVRDTGTGIAPEILPHVFEPFFTTKGPAQGTGLGLATVYGIVEQHHGRTQVRSVPGEGAVFEILLPEVCGPAPPHRGAGGDGRGGNETILLVEDDADVLALEREVLEGYGYRVLPARDGVEALRVVEGAKWPVRLLLTDVVMPQMSGRELAARLLERRPDLRVLYVSGYTPDPAFLRAVEEDRVPFLPKPYTVQELLRRVREVLDDAPAPRPARA